MNKTKSLSTTTIPSSSLLLDYEDEEDEDNLSESNLLEDFKLNPNSCAFPSTNDDQCLTNEQVYHLLNNRSDLMEFSKTIDKKINNPNEQICTSIDLSLCFILFKKFIKKNDLFLYFRSSL